MLEPGEHCTVVFALIVTEQAGECVGGWDSWEFPHPPPPTPLAGSVTLYANTTAHCSPDSSMLLTIFATITLIYIKLVVKLFDHLKGTQA
jgi:hypothetical protein